MQGFREDKWSYLPLLLVLPLIAVILIVASSDPPQAGSDPLSPAETRAIRRTEALLDGIPQHGAVLGDPQAPVTLQFFGDLKCWQSREVMLGALPLVIRRWVRPGKLRILYRSTKTDTLDWREFRRQQIAALAAGEQHKLWTFIDLFYREQRPEYARYADDDFLARIAEQADVDPWSWSRSRESDAWIGKIESDEILAGSRDVGPTPSFLIGPTGGEARLLRHFSLEEPKVFEEAIRGLL